MAQIDIQTIEKIKKIETLYTKKYIPPIVNIEEVLA